MKIVNIILGFFILSGCSSLDANRKIASSERLVVTGAAAKAFRSQIDFRKSDRATCDKNSCKFEITKADIYQEEYDKDGDKHTHFKFVGDNASDLFNSIKMVGESVQESGRDMYKVVTPLEPWPSFPKSSLHRPLVGCSFNDGNYRCSMHINEKDIEWE